MSCGTPVLTYGSGGVLETVKDGISGMFFYERTTEGFKEVLDEFLKRDWNYEQIARITRQMSDKEGFKKEFREFLVDNGILIK